MQFCVLLIPYTELRFLNRKKHYQIQKQLRSSSKGTLDLNPVNALKQQSLIFTGIRIFSDKRDRNVKDLSISLWSRDSRTNFSEFRCQQLI